MVATIVLIHRIYVTASTQGGSICCCECILDWLWNITYNHTLLEYKIQPRTTARSQPQTATPPQLQAQPRPSLSGRPEQASPTGTQRPTVVSPPRSNSPGVPQQFTPHSPKPVPFNLLNLSSQHSQPNQMQTLILSNTNLEGLMYLQRKFMGIISPLILIVRQWTMRTLTKTKSTAKSRSFSQGLGFSNTST